MSFIEPSIFKHIFIKQLEKACNLKDLIRAKHPSIIGAFESWRGLCPFCPLPFAPVSGGLPFPGVLSIRLLEEKIERTVKVRKTKDSEAMSLLTTNSVERVISFSVSDPRMKSCESEYSLFFDDIFKCEEFNFETIKNNFSKFLFFLARHNDDFDWLLDAFMVVDIPFSKFACTVCRKEGNAFNFLKYYYESKGRFYADELFIATLAQHVGISIPIELRSIELKIISAFRQYPQDKSFNDETAKIFLADKLGWSQKRIDKIFVREVAL